MRMLLVVLLAAGLVAMPAEARKANAENVDFGRVTCAEFIEDVQTSSEDDIGYVLIWLDGYLSGLTGDTVMRPAGLEAFAENLVLRCQQRGRDLLLDAARRVGVQH